MKIEGALEKLEELLGDWGLDKNDWILIAQYAYRLLGYDVKVREGHLNILANKTKLLWEVKEGLEAHPRVGTSAYEQHQQFMKKTGFEVDINPLSPHILKERLKESVSYTLPNKKQINVLTPKELLKELDNLLSLCNAEGWGEEKGARVLKSVKNQIEVFKKRDEKELVEAYEKLFSKYRYLLEEAEELREMKPTKELSGISASKGKVEGKVKVILDPKEVRLFRKGKILVTSMTSPRFMPAIGKAVAIVTDEGGMLCHAAIVSRELGTPCIVGTKIATKVLKDGDLVEVDAEEGVVRTLRSA